MIFNFKKMWWLVGSIVCIVSCISTTEYTYRKTRAIYDAVCANQYQKVQYFIQKLTPEELVVLKDTYFAYEWAKENCVFAAVRIGNFDMFKYLVKVLDFPLTSVTQNTRDTLLLYAANYGHEALIHYFLHDAEVKMDPYAVDNNSATFMHKLVSSGNVALLKKYMQIYAFDPYASKSLWGLQHYAAQSGNTKMLEYVLQEYGLSPYEVTTGAKATVLHVAKSKEMIDYCIKNLKLYYRTNTAYNESCSRWIFHLCDLDVVQEYADTYNIDYVKEFRGSATSPLDVAITTGSLEKVIYCLDTLKIPVTTKDNDADTVLHQAIIAEQYHIFNYFVTQHGCDPLVCNEQGYNCLHTFARYCSDVSFFEYLLDSFNFDIQAQTADGFTVVDLLIAQGKTDILDVCVKRYTANIVTECKSLINRLFLAINYKHLAMVKKLVALCGTFIIMQVDAGGCYPIHKAAYCGARDIVTYFIESGCDKNLLTQNADRSCSVLGIAAIGGQLEMVKFLINTYSVDPQNVAAKNRTILHDTAVGKSCELFDYFVTTHNLNPFCIDSNGDTCLHHASLRNNAIMIEHLIARYALDVHAINGNGYTPLGVALQYKNSHSIECLLDMGSILNPNDMWHMLSAYEESLLFAYASITMLPGRISDDVALALLPEHDCQQCNAVDVRCPWITSLHSFINHKNSSCLYKLLARMPIKHTVKIKEKILPKLLRLAVRQLPESFCYLLQQYRAENDQDIQQKVIKNLPEQVINKTSSYERVIRGFNQARFFKTLLQLSATTANVTVITHDLTMV